MDQKAEIPKETLKQLGEFGLFGQQIPEEYGKPLFTFPQAVFKTD